MSITRKQIIEHLTKILKPNSYVYAFWLEGADSLGTVDRYSDIDFWLDVADGYEDKIMKLIQQSLNKLDKLDLVQKYNHPDLKIKQHFFHIQHSSPFLLLDVCIQSHSRKFSFIKEMIHERTLVIFDKIGVTKSKSLNKKQFNKEIKLRIEELKQNILQSSRVSKYIYRQQFLEALVYFYKWIMSPLVEIVRIYHDPLKHEMGLVHISTDLPPVILKKLEKLYSTKSLNDIKKNMAIALKVFEEYYNKVK
jgi:hypothetical protein